MHFYCITYVAINIYQDVNHDLFLDLVFNNESFYLTLILTVTFTR